MTNEPEPFGATWWAATMDPVPERAPLGHDLDVDVCVIGAGLAGLTVAREVARRGWSVVVLERRRVAWNASGRNAGMVSAGFAERLDTIVDRVGLPRAKELWALSQEGVDYVRAAGEGLTTPGGRLSVQRVDDEDAIIRHVAMLNVDFGEHAEVWPTEQVREVLRTPRYYQAVHYPSAFQVHPLNYAQRLAAQAEAAGARIFENTAATALDPAGVRKRIETRKGRIRAAHVVLAGNVHLGALAPAVAGTVLPMASYLAVTQPLGAALAEAIRYGGAVADTRRTGNYYRVLLDGRLMWGMGLSARTSPPRRLKALMRRDLLRVYPQLGEVEIDYAWAGTLGYAVHRMPQVGELGPGYWLAGAFGNHGIDTSAMAGLMIARAILDGDDRWRLFSPYELVWTGGPLGRVAAQLVAWGSQAGDAVRERISQRQEAARRRAAEKAAIRAAVEAARIEAEERAKREAEETMRLAEEAAARWAAQAEERRLVAARAAEVAGLAAAPATAAPAPAEPVASAGPAAETSIAPFAPGVERQHAAVEDLRQEIAAPEAQAAEAAEDVATEEGAKPKHHGHRRKPDA